MKFSKIFYASSLLVLVLFNHESWAHGHGHSSFGFFIGAPFYSYPFYPYPYYGYPYYYPPTIVTTPPVYIQQSPPVTQQYAPGYWYYCSKPAGYYPYIKECPGGWQQVESTPR